MRDEARKIGWSGFAAVVFLAFAVRAVNAYFLLRPENPHFDPARCVGADMWGNDLQARQAAEGGFPKEFYHHAPLYVHLVAIIYSVTDRNFAAVYWIQIAIGALLCGLVYWMGRRAWNARVGLLAGFAHALYGPIIFNETTFMADALAPAFATALVAMLMLLQGASRRLIPLAAAAGLLLGLAISMRANFALFAAAVVPWMLLAPRAFSLPRRAAALAPVALVALAVVAPFCYHNTRAKGKLSFTQVEAEKPWRMSWGKESTGYFHYPRGYPKNELHDPLSLAWAPLLARKIRFLLSWYEFPDLYNYYVDGRFSPVLRWNPLGFWIIGPLAIVGMMLGLRRARGDLSPLYLALASHAVSLVLFYAAARFRAAVMPLIILFAASAALWIVDQARALRWRGPALALAGAMALAFFSRSLDPSGFHSIWYSDSMIESMLLQDADRAIRARDYERMRSVANRLLGIRRATAQLSGYSLLAELDRVQSGGQSRGKNAEVVARLRPLVEKQPVIDQFGGTFFPPTAGFDPIDPFDSVAPPEKALGLPPPHC